MAYPPTTKLNDSFKNDNAQMNSTKIKKDKKLLIKALTLRKGLYLSKVIGPIDQALSIWNDMRANRQHSKKIQRSIRPRRK
mgnify:CR=1 FL=1